MLYIYIYTHTCLSVYLFYSRSQLISNTILMQYSRYNYGYVEDLGTITLVILEPLQQLMAT